MTHDEGIWVIGYGSLIFKPPPHTAVKMNGFLNGYIRRFWQSSSDHRGTPERPGRVVTIIPISDLQRNEKFHDDLHLYELSGVRPHKESEMVPNDTASNADLEGAHIIEKHRKISSLESDDLKVWGCACYIPPEHVQEVKNYLDIREQDGYTSHKVSFYLNLDESQKNDPKVSKALSTLTRDSNENYVIESTIYIGTIDNESFVGPEDINETARVIRGSKGPSGENSEYLLNLCEAVRTLDVQGRSRDNYLEDLVKLVTNTKK